MSLMQRIPLHAKEVQIFKPDSLADQKTIPAFTLKAPTRREREDMMYAIRQDGLRRYSQEEMREAMIEELCRLWECDKDDANVAKLRAYWQAADDYAEEAEALALEAEAARDAGEDAPAELAPFEHPETAAVAELLDRLDDLSPRLRRMAISNEKFARSLPRYAVAHCLTGWEGLETQPRFENEVLKIDVVHDLEGELEDQFGDMGKVAVNELAAAAIGRFFMSKAAEKNSSSGPASQQTPLDTKATGSGKTAGQSQASGTSTETPAG